MLPLTIAWRFLVKSKTQTLLITTGIAVGVGVLIFVGSLLAGLREDLIDTTIGSSAHVAVRDVNRFDRLNDAEVLNQLETFGDGNIKVVSPVRQGPANVLLDEGNDPILLRGLDLERANVMYDLSARIVEGRFAQSNDEVVIGESLKANVGVTLGDTIEVFIPERFTSIELRVVGVFDLGVTSLNDTWVIGTLEASEGWFEDAGLSVIEIQLFDVFDSPRLAGELSQMLGGSVRVSEWQASNQELLSGLEGQAISGVMIQAFVLVSVVLGIASVLAISVLQKSKQLGILKAMGITHRKASLIFLFQGLLLGLFGAAIGVGLGLGLSWSFTTFALNPDGTPILAIALAWDTVIVSVLVSIIASLGAALIPARRSAKLSVIEVIRNG